MLFSLFTCLTHCNVTSTYLSDNEFRHNQQHSYMYTCLLHRRMSLHFGKGYSHIHQYLLGQNQNDCQFLMTRNKANNHGDLVKSSSVETTFVLIFVCTLLSIDVPTFLDFLLAELAAKYFKRTSKLRYLPFFLYACRNMAILQFALLQRKRQRRCHQSLLNCLIFHGMNVCLYEFVMVLR